MGNFLSCGSLLSNYSIMGQANIKLINTVMVHEFIVILIVQTESNIWGQVLSFKCLKFSILFHAKFCLPDLHT